jgi:membrane-bound lytic murein transglycosylase D
LASLAGRYGVSEANVAAWNKVKPGTKLAAGQTLTILMPSQGSRRVTRAAAKAPAVGKAAGKAPVKGAGKAPGKRPPQKSQAKR